MTHTPEWDPPVPGLYGSSFRFGEWIGGPVTPLFEDWALPRLEAAMHDTHKGWSGQPAPLPHHVVINGWYFYSLAWLPVTARALLRWAPSMAWHLARHPRRLAPIIPPTTKYGIGLYERDWRAEVHPRYLAETAEAGRRIDAADVADLPRLIDGLLDLAGEYFAWVTVVGGAAYKAEAQLVAFYRKRLAPKIGGTHLTLLIGLDSPTQAAPHAVDTLDWSSPTLGERGIEARPRSAETKATLLQRREAAEQEARAALAPSRRQQRQFEELMADHFRMGPDIPLGMPFGILVAICHRPTPRLGLSPIDDVFDGCLFECLPIHDQISTSRASLFGTIAWCCQCVLCFIFSTNSGRTNFARPVTRPPDSVLR